MSDFQCKGLDGVKDPQDAWERFKHDTKAEERWANGHGSEDTEYLPFLLGCLAGAYIERGQPGATWELGNSSETQQ